METPNEKSNSSVSRAVNGLHILAVIFIAGTGAYVRLYGLSAESIDLEEFACIGAIGSADFSTFFSEQRQLYPYGAPLAPVLIYFWSLIAGDAIGNIRLLFALTGILVMLLGYVAALVFFHSYPNRRRAALVVLVCIAFSPVHVFHSHEARMYALVSLFTLVGMISFLFALQGRRRAWWGIHLAANACMIASHYFTIFILPVYGVSLLLYERRVTMRMALWGVGHALLALLLFLWVAAIPKQAEELYSYYELPSVYNVLIHLIAADSTNLSATSFFPSSASWGIFPSAVQYYIQNAHPFFDVLLAGISVAAICIGVLFLVRNIRYRNTEEIFRWLLLLLWAMLPTLLVVLLSLLWQPIYGSRYVMYSMFSVYLLAGGISTLLPGRYLYTALLLIITVIYAYQLSIALPPQTRSAWRQAYDQTCRDSNNAAILLLEDPFFKPVLEANLPDVPPVPVVAAFERDTLCTAIPILHAPIADNSAAAQTEIWVLLVLTTDFDENPFINCLSRTHSRYERYFYPGERDLALYHIIPETVCSENPIVNDDSLLFINFSESISAHNMDMELLTPVDELKYLSDEEGGFWLRLGITLSLYGEHALASRSFSKAVQINLNAASRILDIAAQVNSTLDVRLLAEKALQHTDTICNRLKQFMQTAYYNNSPDFIDALGNTAADICQESLIYRGIAAHKKGDHESAVAFFEKFFGLHNNLPPEIIESFAISLTETKKYDRAITILRAGIERWPSYHWLSMRLGIAEAASGNHESAITAFRISHEQAPDNAYIIYLMIESLVALEQYAEASELSLLPAIQSKKDTWVLLACWRALTGAGRDKEAQAVFQQLAQSDEEFKPFLQYLYVDKDVEKVYELLDNLNTPDKTVFPEVYMLLERLKHQ